MFALGWISGRWRGWCCSELRRWNLWLAEPRAACGPRAAPCLCAVGEPPCQGTQSAAPAHQHRVRESDRQGPHFEEQLNVALEQQTAKAARLGPTTPTVTSRQLVCVVQTFPSSQTHGYGKTRLLLISDNAVFCPTSWFTHMFRRSQQCPGHVLALGRSRPTGSPGCSRALLRPGAPRAPGALPAPDRHGALSMQAVFKTP